MKDLEPSERAYLLYLNQAAAEGLPPDGRRWDTPCPRFKKTGEKLLRLGYARRVFWLFGPLVITWKGLRAIRDWALR
jgi:hypothetical protein